MALTEDGLRKVRYWHRDRDRAGRAAPAGVLGRGALLSMAASWTPTGGERGDRHLVGGVSADVHRTGRTGAGVQPAGAATGRGVAPGALPSGPGHDAAVSTTAFRTETTRLAQAQPDSGVFGWKLPVVGVPVSGGLVVVQLFPARATRRTLNAGLLVATAACLLSHRDPDGGVVHGFEAVIARAISAEYYPAG